MKFQLQMVTYGAYVINNVERGFIAPVKRAAMTYLMINSMEKISTNYTSGSRMVPPTSLLVVPSASSSLGLISPWQCFSDGQV